MAKNRRLTVRLDEELNNTIEQAGKIGKCDKTAIVIDALKKGFGLDKNTRSPLTGLAAEHGKVKPTYLVDATGPVSRITGLIVDGKNYKYCEKCKKFYGRDESGKVVFWNGQ